MYRECFCMLLHLPHAALLTRNVAWEKDWDLKLIELNEDSKTTGDIGLIYISML
jgi:hypothetical protein